MKFGNIDALHFLWVLPGLILFLIRAGKRRMRAIESFAESSLIDDLTGSFDRKKTRLRTAILLIVIFLFVITLIRPQWGFRWQEVKRTGLDILIAIDTSKSMLAEDVKPDRLNRSKLAVKDLIKKLRGDRIGLIAFSGSAFLQSPLTVDYSGFLLSLNALNIDTIPKGGTSITSAIKAAINGYEGGQKKYKVLMIITDGEDHEGELSDIVAEAKNQGIKIFTIGIGTTEGELIPVTDEKGNRFFLKDRSGNVVKTRLDEATLQKIALTTGGSYVKATNSEFGLDLLYREKLSKMERREIENKMVKDYTERFQIPLLIAIILLCLEPFIRERRGV